MSASDSESVKLSDSISSDSESENSVDSVEADKKAEDAASLIGNNFLSLRLPARKQSTLECGWEVHTKGSLVLHLNSLVQVPVKILLVVLFLLGVVLCAGALYLARHGPDKSYHVSCNATKPADICTQVTAIVLNFRFCSGWPN